MPNQERNPFTICRNRKKKISGFPQSCPHCGKPLASVKGKKRGTIMGNASQTHWLDRSIVPNRLCRPIDDLVLLRTVSGNESFQCSTGLTQTPTQTTPGVDGGIGAERLKDQLLPEQTAPNGDESAD